MVYTLLKVAALTATVVSAMKSACPGKQLSLQASASDWPEPTGAIGSYISSYSRAHSGVFSNCQDFTSTMPASLSSPYQAWVTSVRDWSVSFESTVAAAQSTCLALVAVVVIPIPRCADDAVATGGSSASTTASTSPPAASSTSTGDAGGSTNSSSGASPLGLRFNTLYFTVAVCVGAIGALAIAL